MDWDNAQKIAEETVVLKNKEAYAVIFDRLREASVPYKQAWRFRAVIWELRRRLKPRSKVKAPLDELKQVWREVVVDE